MPSGLSTSTATPIPLAASTETLAGTKEEIAADFVGLADGAYRGNGIVFACLRARMALFRQARFQFQQMRNGHPGDMFGTPELQPLETPWPNGNTGDLLARMIQDVDLAGNAFVARRAANQLRRLRPDWVTIVFDGDAADIDTTILGYVYHPGGRARNLEPVTLDRSEVAHFIATPDPLAQFRGMSWMTPLLREIASDVAATEHKWNYFVQGATPNLKVVVPPEYKARRSPTG